MLATCLCASAKGYSQTITLSQKNASLEKVFKEINKRTGYTFVYTESLIQKAKKVTIVTKNASLEEVLKLCFKDQPLTFSILNTLVIIKEKGTQRKAVLQSNKAPAPIIVSGKITNQNGEPFVNASVAEKGTNASAITKEDGTFTIEVSNPNATLVISYVGYEKKEVAITNQTNITVSLIQANAQLSDVVIVGYGTQKKVNLTGAVETVK